MTFWSFISEIGIQQKYGDILAKRIRLTNQFGFVGFLIFLFSGIGYFFIGDTFSGIVTVSFALLCLTVFPFNKRRFHKFATSFALISCGTALFYFDSYSGLASGTYLFHFPLAFAISFVFDYKEKKTMLLHFMLPIILLGINFATNRELFASTICISCGCAMDRSFIFQSWRMLREDESNSKSKGCFQLCGETK